jgi:hypothetical protein
MSSDPVPDARESLAELAQRLVFRLERLSVDSHWAVHASGVRRSLLRALDDLTTGDPSAPARLEALLPEGFKLIERAAREMGDRE